jgi:superfamily II DNA or RNA helicase
MQQWAIEIAKFYRGRVGRFGDGERSLHAVTVATYASAWRHMTRLGGLFPLVVVDEAHHVGDGQLAEALEMALASDRLGLTATPNEGEIAERGRRLLGDVVFELQVRDLVGEALAHYDLVRVRVALDPQERLQYDAEVALFEPVYHRWRQGRRHARWRDFVMAAQRDPDSRAALAAWRRAQRLAAYPQAKAQAVGRLLERHAWDRCLVFTPDNAVTYAISRDHLVAPVTCDTSRRERKAVLEDFSAHRIASLVSARVLNEGLDLPDANVGVMVGGRGGKREFIQRLGRVLRPAPGKRARIYELLTAGSVDSWRKSRRGSP